MSRLFCAEPLVICDAGPADKFRLFCADPLVICDAGPVIKCVEGRQFCSGILLGCCWAAVAPVVGHSVGADVACAALPALPCRVSDSDSEGAAEDIEPACIQAAGSRTADPGTPGRPAGTDTPTVADPSSCVSVFDSGTPMTTPTPKEAEEACTDEADECTKGGDTGIDSDIDSTEEEDDNDGGGEDKEMVKDDNEEEV